MNQQYFGGQCIFNLGENCQIQFAEDRLVTMHSPGQQMGVPMMMHTQAPQQVYVTTMQPGTHVNNAYLYSSQQQPLPVVAAVAVAQQAPINTAELFIDESMQPGSVITVTAPNGTLVNITLPKDTIPGCVLTYAY